jgi:hypothetical protein
MHHSRTRTAALLGAGLALALPASALARKGSEDQPGKGKSEKVEKVEAQQQAPELEPADEQKKPTKTDTGHGKGKNYVFVGRVVSFDDATDTLTLTVTAGNRHARGVTPKRVVFDVSAARYKLLDRDGDGEQSIADLLVGEQIKVKARPSKGAGTAAKPFAASKVEGKRGVEEEDEPEDEPEDTDDPKPPTELPPKPPA